MGTVGLPARYGGFETLAEQLILAAEQRGIAHRFTVWCSAPQSGPHRPPTFHGATLRYLPLKANGAQSIPYDVASLWQAARSGHRTALLLGVSGAIALPALRAIPQMRIITHVDGIEWQRPKWGRAARAFLHRSEASAARWSHSVIADNPMIARHIRDSYGRDPVNIAYGHEHARAAPAARIDDLHLPARYALALARAEPENNLIPILDAFTDAPLPLVMVANWNDTPHGRVVLARYANHPNLYLLGAEYDPARLRAIRDRAVIYLHGHGAGGTNPGLVEMMGFGVPIAAWDCGFNRATTHDAAAYFDSAASLRASIPALCVSPMGAHLRSLATTHYCWRDVTDAYFRLLGV